MFFISIIKNNFNLGPKFKCTICSKEISMKFNPMKEWLIEGPLCGDCYSRKLSEYYPGNHVRVNKE